MWTLGFSRLRLKLEIAGQGQPRISLKERQGNLPIVPSFALLFYSLASVISIVETILALFSPSLAGISSVPNAILFTFKSFMKRLLVISATSTAVEIARPRAFKVISLALDADRPVMTART